MSTITSCPRCTQHVTLPHGAEASDTVRCPLCNAEYALAEALAAAPPTLVVIRSLAVIAPEHPAESESALHLFPADESGVNLADAAAGSSGINLADAGAASSGIDLDEVAPAPSDLMAHIQSSSERPADDFAAAEADELELPADELPIDTSAGAETAPSGAPWATDGLAHSESPAGDSADDAHLEMEQGDFLASFDESEPGAEEAMPAIVDDLPAEELPHAPDLAAAEAEWLGGQSAEGEEVLDLAALDAADDESSALAPDGLGDALGDALAEQGDDEISFATEEDEPGSDTINLDSGFEETRPIPDDVEGYALDPESAETDEAPEPVAAAAPPARAARRKPSMITRVIMNVLGLVIILPTVYLVMVYYGKMDPLHLAPSLPGWIVPPELRGKPMLASAAHVPLPAATEAAADPNANVPPGQDDAPPVPDSSGTDSAAAGADNSDDAAMADDAKPADATAADDNDDNVVDDANKLGATLPDDNAPGDTATGDTAAADMPENETADADAGDADAADAAAMAADAAARDSGEAPGDADVADADSADADAAPADDAMPDDAPVVKGEIAVGGLDEPADDAMPDDKAADDANADDMPAAADATAESIPADSGAPDTATTDADPDDADDAKDLAAKDAPADDSAVGAALDDAMADDKAAEPEAAVGPRESVQYSPDDVDRALTELAAAAKAMDEAPKEDINQVRKFKGQYYRKLYQLAEVATFTPAMAAAAEAAQGSQQDLVDHTLTGSAASPGKFTEVGRAAAQWLAAIKGKEHQGIVLAGTIKSTRQRGEVFETLVLLTDDQTVVTVLSPAAPTLGPKSAVLVWGTVAEDPAQNIAGYEGDAPTAVWTPGIEAAPPGAARTGKAAGSERR